MKILFSLVFLLITTMAFGQQYYGGTASPNYKSAVASVGALPASGNQIGDIRLELTGFGLYGWNGASWSVIASGGGGGTVTSVALSDGSGTPIYNISGSPIVGAGTLSFTLKNENANLVFAGPTAAGPSQPTFRSLVAADIPALPYSSSTLTSSHLFVGNAGNVATDVAVSGDLTLANTGSFTIANSAVTNAKIANATIDLTAKVTGVLPVANGGTNSSTALNNNRVMVSSGGAIVEEAAITGNRALASSASGLPVASVTTDTELGYVSGVTSSIQTQLNSKLSSALATNDIFVGSPGGVATDVPMSGDATIVSSGALTIANSAITNAKIANATIDLTTKVTGALPIANGGTGQTTANAAFNALSPMTTLGDIEYEDATPKAVRLAGNITATRKFLRQLGTGAVSAAPVWDTLIAGDIPALPYASSTLTSSHLFVGNAGNVATDVAASGDVSLANTGAFTVNTVGGSSAANIHTAEQTINNSESANLVFSGPSSGAAAAPTFRSLVLADIPSLQVNKNLYVDGSRTDSYTADGSSFRPFKTITAAIGQVITNADNATHQYVINVTPGAYAETLTFNNALLYNLIISSTNGSGEVATQNTTVTGITSTSTNTNLATLIFNNITVNGNVNFTGDINNTNLCSSQCLFIGSQINNSAGTITLNNVNNVSFYGGQIQGGGSVATFTNVAFAYMQGAEGWISGTTLHLVNNGAGNQPSQFSGNYLLLSGTKIYATTTIDAGSELDMIQTYQGSSGSITNNGTLHSFGSDFQGSLTFNNGSSNRFRGDMIHSQPTVNGGATVTNQDDHYLSGLQMGQKATPNTPASGNDDLYFKNDDHLYSKNSAGTETKIDTGGTVTSVAQTVPVEFSIAGSPITTSGTLAITKATETANTVWAGPTSGGAVVPTFRALVGADLPNPSSTTLGGVESYASVSHQWINSISTSGVPSSTQPAFTDISGTATIAQGGTGQVTATAAFDALSPLTTKGDVIAFDGTHNVRVPVGTNGQVLSANSAQSSGLQWVNAATGSVTSVAFSDGSGTPIFTISGSPVTTSGTLTETLTTQSANTIFAGPTSGGAVQPTFRAMVDADLPSNSPVINTATKTTTYTAVANDVILADATAAAFTITIPLAASNTNKMIKIKKIDSTAHTITLTASGADTIDGQASQTLPAQYDSAELISNGTLWYAF